MRPLELTEQQKIDLLGPRLAVFLDIGELTMEEYTYNLPALLGQMLFAYTRIPSNFDPLGTFGVMLIYKITGKKSIKDTEVEYMYRQMEKVLLERYANGDFTEAKS